MYGQFNPYQQIMPQMNTQGLIRVNGIDGAKAYQMGANSQVALFDANDDVFYVKFTDGAGFPTIRTFKFEEMHNFGKNQENNVENKQYVSREEMEAYVKQFIQQQSNNTSSTSQPTTNADGKSNVKQKWNDSRTDG